MAKVTAKKAAVKTAEVKPEVKVEAKVAAPAKVEAPKTEVKAEAKVEAPKAPAKKVPAKKTTAKAVVTSKVTVEFSGKSYTEEDLVKIAKDVWKYDLKKKVADFKSVEIYVKPEESMAYYVINGEIKGGFAI